MTVRPYGPGGQEGPPAGPHGMLGPVIGPLPGVGVPATGPTMPPGPPLKPKPPPPGPPKPCTAPVEPTLMALICSVITEVGKGQLASYLGSQSGHRRRSSPYLAQWGPTCPISNVDFAGAGGHPGSVAGSQ